MQFAEAQAVKTESEVGEGVLMGEIDGTTCIKTEIRIVNTHRAVKDAVVPRSVKSNALVGVALVLKERAGNTSGRVEGLAGGIVYTNGRGCRDTTEVGIIEQASEPEAASGDFPVKNETTEVRIGTNDGLR